MLELKLSLECDGMEYLPSITCSCCSS